MMQSCDCFVSSYFLKFSSWRMTESLCPWQKGAKPCLRSNDPKGGARRGSAGDSGCLRHQISVLLDVARLHLKELDMESLKKGEFS